MFALYEVCIIITAYICNKLYFIMHSYDLVVLHG